MAERYSIEDTMDLISDIASEIESYEEDVEKPLSVTPDETDRFIRTVERMIKEANKEIKVLQRRLLVTMDALKTVERDFDEVL